MATLGESDRTRTTLGDRATLGESDRTTLVEFYRSISGFRLMRNISYLEILPSLFIILYCLYIDSTKKNESGAKKFKLTYVGILTFLSVIFFFLEFFILCVRLFNQRITGEFNVLTLFAIFFSSILIFTNVYFLIHLNDEGAFFMANKPPKNEKYFYTKTYFNCFYYSTYSLFTQGFGNIYPSKVYTKMISCLQMAISFILTSYIFSKIIANSEHVK